VEQHSQQTGKVRAVHPRFHASYNAALRGDHYQLKFQVLSEGEEVGVCFCGSQAMAPLVKFLHELPLFKGDKYVGAYLQVQVYCFFAPSTEPHCLGPAVSGAPAAQGQVPGVPAVPETPPRPTQDMRQAAIRRLEQVISTLHTFRTYTLDQVLAFPQHPSITHLDYLKATQHLRILRSI